MIGVVRHMAEKKTAKNTEAAAEQTRGRPKYREGLVISDKMDKTVVVETTRQVQHPQYGKFVRKTQRHFAHDKDNSCKIGDRVRIVESRRLSKKKRWRLQEILVKAL